MEEDEGAAVIEGEDGGEVVLGGDSGGVNVEATVRVEESIKVEEDVGLEWAQDQLRVSQFQFLLLSLVLSLGELLKGKAIFWIEAAAGVADSGPLPGITVTVTMTSSMTITSFVTTSRLRTGELNA